MATKKKDKDRNPIFDQILKDKKTYQMQVESWDKKVFFNQFTLMDADWIARHAQGEDGATVAYTLICKLLDEEGNKMFTVADKQILMRNFSSEELSNIAVQMRKTMTADGIDYEGK